jgi:hypothetical protein
LAKVIISAPARPSPITTTSRLGTEEGGEGVGLGEEDLGEYELAIVSPKRMVRENRSLNFIVNSLLLDDFFYFFIIFLFHQK